MPKTFLAVNLSDAFNFQEKEKQHQTDNDNDVLEMKPAAATAAAEREQDDDQATPLAIPPSSDPSSLAAQEQVSPVDTSLLETPRAVEYEQAPLGISVAPDTSTAAAASDTPKPNVSDVAEGSQY